MSKVPTSAKGPDGGSGHFTKTNRFQPGQSGNPKGRPRKEAAARTLSPLEQIFQQVIMEEGDRHITITEGGKQSTLTVIQAVARSTHVAAMKGNAQAQRTLLTLRLEIERRRQQEHAAAYGRALDLKFELELIRGRWLARRRAEEDMPMHPDDIEIDPSTLDVRIHHPFSLEHRKARADAVEARDELILDLALAEEDLDARLHPAVGQAVARARSILAQYNDALPPRLRRDRVDQIPGYGNCALEGNTNDEDPIGPAASPPVHTEEHAPADVTASTSADFGQAPTVTP